MTTTRRPKIAGDRYSLIHYFEELMGGSLPCMIWTVQLVVFTRECNFSDFDSAKTYQVGNFFFELP